MISKWRWVLLQLSRQLWVRAALFAVLGLATAVFSIFAERFIPWELPGKIGADAVDSILNILASSMLAVTTFSLSVMVQAYAAATSNVTPRATKLVMQDTTTQNVLATFIGTFLFSLVGIVALTTGVYGQRGRLVLFIVVLAVIAIIVITLLRWIDHLSHLGRVGETTDRVEVATAAALTGRVETPCLGGRPWLSESLTPPEGARSVLSDIIGYVQHVDVAGLSGVGDEHDVTIYLTALPGTFVHDDRPLAWVVDAAEDLDLSAVRNAFTVGDERSFEQDPRFGLSVLSEVASRALSPAVNDPGTAIDVIGRAVRLLLPWAKQGEPQLEAGEDEEDGEVPRELPDMRDDPADDASAAADDSAGEGEDAEAAEDTDGEPEVSCPRVFVPPLKTSDLLTDIFAPIARDGAGMIEVQMRLQKALLALAAAGNDAVAAAAIEQSRRAMARAEAALTAPEDVAALRALLQERRESLL